MAAGAGAAAGATLAKHFAVSISVAFAPARPLVRADVPAVSVLDLAASILRVTGPIDVSGLHRLVYYSQVTTLVASGRPLFDERIEAWSIGPVAPKLFHAHEGRWRLQAANLAGVARPGAEHEPLVRAVVSRYGGPQWRSVEDGPWHVARTGLSVAQLTGPELTQAAILAYYRRPSLR